MRITFRDSPVSGDSAIIVNLADQDRELATLEICSLTFADRLVKQVRLVDTSGNRWLRSGKHKEDPMLTSIIGSLIIGLIIGAIARALMPGRDPMGCFATALLGIGGSIVGGLVGSALWPVTVRDGYTHPHRLLHFGLAVVGAIILLALWRAIRR